MALAVEWVGYGRPAAEALRRRIAAAKADEPLTPVTVVVPSNHLGVAARRLLSSGALGPVCGRGVGVAAVTFLTVYRLAELLGSSPLAASGRRPASTPVIAAAMRAALAEAPGVFAPVAAHPATETALVGAYRELRDVSDGGLDAIAAAGSRAADVVGLHRRARDRLEAAWYDEEDLMVAAAGALGAGGGVADHLGAMIVHLPQRLSRHGAALLSAAAGRGDVTVLAGTTGDTRADAEVTASVARLGGGGARAPAIAGQGAGVVGVKVPSGAVGVRSPSGAAGAAGAGIVAAVVTPGRSRFVTAAVVTPGRSRFVTASDADDEVRAGVRAVVDAVRSGSSLDRIAILHPGAEPYARLVHDQLAAAGIPANGAAVAPLAARVAGRTLLGLLALPEGGFRRPDLLAWLAAAPVLHRGRWAPVAAWERASRDAAVVAGRPDWDQRLARLADELDARAAELEADPDQPELRPRRAQEQAGRARDLRSFALGLIDELTAAAAGPRPWGEHGRWCRQLLDRLLGGPERRQMWPSDERRAAERVELAVDRLAALDDIEGAVGLDVFARTLALELDVDLGRVGRFGEGVLVGSMSMGVGLDLDLVVILGLAEGTFPATVRDDSLLPDHERAVAGDELVLRDHRVERQHRQLLAALAGAERQVLCLPRGDLRRSSERVPSRWALDLISSLAGERWWSADVLEGEGAWLTHVASFDGGLRRLTFPATAQEHRLRALLADPAAGDDAILARGMDVVRARRSDRFTRFDGNLAGLRVPSPAGQTTSATRLERWAECPASYLLRDILGVEPVENPEEELQLSPITRGRLVHEALETFISCVLARSPAKQPAPEQAWSDADRARMRTIGEQCCDRYQAAGLTGRPIFWRRDRARILADLGRFFDADNVNRRDRRSRPIAAELAFGLHGVGMGAVPLRLADGREVFFRGKADRVDVAEDGTLHVIDYKTGRKDAYRQLGEDNPDLRGRKLQLPVYGVAARRAQSAPDALVEAEYWFVSARGRFERVHLPVTREVLERVGQTLGVIVNGIESGVFPNHPTGASTSLRVDCEYCDPDGLGVTELRRRWDRKRQDLTLALYADLAEPPEAGVDETDLA